MLKEMIGEKMGRGYYNMRNKPFTIITYKKYEEPKQHFNCRIHGSRLLEISGKGLWCTEGCGPTILATRTVFTLNNPSNLKQKKRRIYLMTPAVTISVLSSHSPDSNAAGGR